jgi:hypothetical protein
MILLHISSLSFTLLHHTFSGTHFGVCHVGNDTQSLAFVLSARLIVSPLTTRVFLSSQPTSFLQLNFHWWSSVTWNQSLQLAILTGHSRILLPFNAGIKSLRTKLPDEIFTGDFSSWTVHFVNICLKTQQIHQLFIQFVNYVCKTLHVSALHCHHQGVFLSFLRDAQLRCSR